MVINRMKLAWLKGMEKLGTAASNLASNAKFKAQEIKYETRRREILTEFSMNAFDLWQKGEKLPEPLDAMLRELSELNEKLSALRALKYAAVEQSVETEGEATEAQDLCTEVAEEEKEAVQEAKEAVQEAEAAVQEAEVAVQEAEATARQEIADAQEQLEEQASQDGQNQRTQEEGDHPEGESSYYCG